MRNQQIEQYAPSPDRSPPSGLLEREEADKAMIGFFLESGDLDAESALELIAGYAEEPAQEDLEGMRAYVEGFGIDFASLPDSERVKYATLWKSSREARRDSSRAQIADVFEQELKNALFDKAIVRIQDVRELVLGSKDTEELEARLIDTMDALEDLAKHASPEKEENDALWRKVYDEFVRVMAIRAEATAAGVDVNDVFERVTDRFKDFIEDDIVIRANNYLLKQGTGGGYEDLMRKILGRTLEDVEELKKRNRKAVAEYIQKNIDEPPTIELLQELHRLNNKDVVPEKISQMRGEGAEVVFYKRHGILGGEDNYQETEGVMGRASRVMFSDMSNPRYEMAVSKLHNDILEIHPFMDRNGSTALLFAEFMMSKRGYAPSTEREQGSYYNTVRKIFDNNPIAMALIGSVQIKIAKIPGYFGGDTTKKGEVEGMAKEEKYAKIVRKRMRQMKELEESIKKDSQQ